VVERHERRIGINNDDSNHLLGRMLTLADATFVDPIQRKAQKDMIRQHFREWLTMIENSATGSACIQGWVGRPFSTSVDEIAVADATVT
jgi:hypothetical protein